MRGREFIEFLHRADAMENARLYSQPLLFAKGIVSNWRVFGIDGYVDIKDITRFITIHNLENWVIMLDIARRLYYTDIAVEHNTDVGTRVHISRGH